MEASRARPRVPRLCQDDLQPSNPNIYLQNNHKSTTITHIHDRNRPNTIMAKDKHDKHPTTLPPPHVERSIEATTAGEDLSTVWSDEAACPSQKFKSPELSDDENEDKNDSDSAAEEDESDQSEDKVDNDIDEVDVHLSAREKKKLKVDEEKDEDYDEGSESESEDEYEYDEVGMEEKVVRKGTRVGLRSGDRK